LLQVDVSCKSLACQALLNGPKEMYVIAAHTAAPHQRHCRPDLHVIEIIIWAFAGRD